MLELVAHRSAAWRPATAQLAGAREARGGPSVLFDAVAILASDEGIAELADHPAARDFVADAHAHRKFIAYTAAAAPLLEKAGVADQLDEGYIALDKRAARPPSSSGVATCGTGPARCRPPPPTAPEAPGSIP